MGSQWAQAKETPCGVRWPSKYHSQRHLSRCPAGHPSTSSVPHPMHKAGSSLRCRWTKHHKLPRETHSLAWGPACAGTSEFSLQSLPALPSQLRTPNAWRTAQETSTHPDGPRSASEATSDPHPRPGDAAREGTGGPPPAPARPRLSGGARPRPLPGLLPLPCPARAGPRFPGRGRPLPAPRGALRAPPRLGPAGSCSKGGAEPAGYRSGRFGSFPVREAQWDMGPDGPHSC